MLGGLGICGRPFCCAQFLDEFLPVSIKMAKTQNLSLNPTKISGTCGRLMCCLKYEQDAYEDLLKTSPKPESFVDTPEGRGNRGGCESAAAEREGPDGGAARNHRLLPQLRDLRGAQRQGQKERSPIPADLAPISGEGKRPKKALAEAEPPMHLDPIRFPLPPRRHCGGGAAPGGSAPPQERGAKV